MRDESHLRPQGLQGDGLQSLPVDEYPPVRGIVKPRDEPHQGALAGTVAPDESRELPRLDREVDLLQDCLQAIGKRYVAERDLPLLDADRPGIAVDWNGGGCREDVLDALQTDQSQVVGIDDVGKTAEGAVRIIGKTGEDEKGAQGHRALQHAQAALPPDEGQSQACREPDCAADASGDPL